MKHLLKIGFVVGLLVASSQAVYPCTCIAAGQRRSFRQAEAVFVGRVIEVRDFNGEQPSKVGWPAALEVKLKVEKSWKRAKQPEITLLSQNYTGWCGGFNFVVGEQYLLYSYSEGNWLMADSICTRSVPLAHASDQIKNLNSFWYRLFARVFPF